MLLVLLSTLLIAAFLYILPGFALLAWFLPSPTQSLGEKVGLAVGISLSLYPILALGSYMVGLAPGKFLAWLPGSLALLFLLWRGYFHLRDRPLSGWFSKEGPLSLHDGVWLGVTLVLAYTRLDAASELIAPAWGDSVHHTMIVQLILDHGGIFQSWAPYAPMQTFTYHFGYHVLIACWSWISGMSADQAVLIGTQMLNLLAICVLYPLATKLARGNQVAGIGAMLIAGFFTQMPAYYVNWGRYTQLAAQIILPVFIWLFDEWLHPLSKPKLSILVGIGLTSAGLALTHYRVSVVALAAALAWLLWSSWLHREQWRRWLARLGQLAYAAVGAGLMVLPWLLILRHGRLLLIASNIGSRATDSAINQNELTIWQSLNVYYPYFLWQLSLLALLIALWKNRSLALPVALWGGFSFLVASPFLIGLGGTGLVTNFLLIVGAYIVIAITVGWLVGELSHFLMKLKVGSLVYLALVLITLVAGVAVQRKIVDPFYQLVTESDLKAFTWIRDNVPANARFAVNGFLAFGDTVVVGSDAGWWLPFYTKREATVPPILYSTEALPPTMARTFFRQFVIDVRDSQGEPLRLRQTLCQAAITHVFLGEKQGTVGVGSQPLIPSEWLEQDSDFHLLDSEERAQVWGFDRTTCKPM